MVMSTLKRKPSRYGSKEERSQYEKELRQRNPKYAQRQRDNANKWRKQFPEKKNYYDWAYHIKQHYGISAEEYKEMLINQGGGCKLCGRKPIKNRLPIDHNHSTGKVRGILCTPCNRAVGILEHNIDKLVEYLK